MPVYERHMPSPNMTTLQKALQSGLGAKFLSGIYRHSDSIMMVGMADDTTPEEWDLMKQIIREHNPETATPKQIERRERDESELFRIRPAQAQEWIDSRTDDDAMVELVRAFCRLREIVHRKH